MSFRLEIISPQDKIFNDEIDLCVMPGIEGDFGVFEKSYAFFNNTTSWNSIHL